MCVSQLCRERLEREERERNEVEEKAQQAQREAEWVSFYHFKPLLFYYLPLPQQAQLEAVQAEEREMLETKSLPLRNYLMRHVLPTVTQGLIEVSKTKPEDPVDYLVCVL